MGGGHDSSNNSNYQESEESEESIKHMGPMLTDASLMKSHVIRGSSVSTRGSGNPSMEETTTFSSSGVREAFVQFFVSLLSCYRHCYVVDEHPEDPAPMGKFKVIENQIWDKKQFVHEQSRSYQAGRDSRDFLSFILETQLFEDFVRTHTPREDAPTEICLFDEYVVLFRGTLFKIWRNIFVLAVLCARPIKYIYIHVKSDIYISTFSLDSFFLIFF